jgi:membrane protein required for colicin V production
LNFYDWVLIALFAIGALWGFRKGLVDAVLLVISIYVALLLSGLFAGRLLSLIWDDAENQALATAIGYVIIFVGVFFASSIVSRIIKASLKAVYAGWIDKVGGILVGIVAGVLLAGGLMAVMARYTYVVDLEGAGVSEEDDLSDESIVNRLRDTAEGFLNDSAREQFDEWLVGSEVVDVLIDIRNVLPGSALGMYPQEFNTAIDILESKKALQAELEAEAE